MTIANDRGRAALNPNLTDAEEKALRLRETGVSVNQIAREWGVTRDTVRSFLRRAHIKLIEAKQTA